MKTMAAAPVEGGQFSIRRGAPACPAGARPVEACVANLKTPDGVGGTLFARPKLQAEESCPVKRNGSQAAGRQHAGEDRERTSSMV